MGMGIDVFERQAFHLCKRPDPDILHHTVRDDIVDMAHKPLGHRGNQDNDTNLHENSSHDGKIHTSRCKNAGNGFTGQNRHIESQDHRNQCTGQ